MAVKKSAKKATMDVHEAISGTLEDYFNRKKTYQSGQMKELSKEMTKHLLVGSGADNAMVVEKIDDANEAPSDAKLVEEVEHRIEHDEDDQRNHASDSDSDSDGGDYEDDYESDSSTTAVDKSVAGLTLEDYLHAKSDGVLPNESEHHKDAKPHVEKLPQKPQPNQKKPLPPALVSGMSLDYYLGASAAAARDDDDTAADSKSPSKKKTKQLKSKGKSTLAALPARSTSHDSKAHDEIDTPYTKQMKKKQMMKQHAGHNTGSSVTKSILLGESGSQLLLAKHVSTPPSKDRKKHHHSSGATSQPPLPKLLGSSPSAHGFVPLANHHSRDTHHHEEGGGADDTIADEKLPRLQHHTHNTSK